jgi:hypothetical protein
MVQLQGSSRHIFLSYCATNPKSFRTCGARSMAVVKMCSSGRIPILEPKGVALRGTSLIDYIFSYCVFSFLPHLMHDTNGVTARSISANFVPIRLGGCLFITRSVIGYHHTKVVERNASGMVMTHEFSMKAGLRHTISGAKCQTKFSI